MVRSTAPYQKGQKEVRYLPKGDATCRRGLPPRVGDEEGIERVSSDVVDPSVWHSGWLVVPSSRCTIGKVRVRVKVGTIR